MFGSEPFLVFLGSRCFITDGVRFITHDGAALIFRDRLPDLDIVAPIRVGDNVFIGNNAIILPGVSIGNNCIIGAGAVVTRDIPDNSVAVGVPARPIKTTDEFERSAKCKSVGTAGIPDAQKIERLRRLFPRN
jgi:acetyltransferase-like isoleucine patch superfamily enzyme